MGFDVTVTRTLAAASEVVRAYMFAPQHDPEWITGIKSVQVPPGPLVVGTRVPRVAAFMGRRIDYVLEVAELGPGELDMRSTDAPFPMRVTYSIAPSGDGRVSASVTIRVRGGAGGMMVLLAPIVRWQIRRNLRRDLRLLGRRLEGDEGRPI